MQTHKKKSASMLRGFPVLLLLLLLAFPALSVQGAANGLRLWSQVILPTLAPFIICTQTIAACDGVALLIRPFYPLIKPLFGLSRSGAYVFLCGLLCGYPLGARLCADFFKAGQIDETEANYLLSFCNHPSPMFVTGYVSAQLRQPVSLILLAACLYLPILPVSLLSRHYYKKREQTRAKTGLLTLSVQEARPFSLDELIMSTCETMVIIGGYIMLFSILSLWVQHMSFIPPGVTACMTGILEITTGVNLLCAVLPPAISVLPVLLTVAFGGCSGIFQTKSVIRNSGLSIRHYVFWKIVHTFFSCLFFILLSVFPLFQ